jgi:hypothetical protein
MAIDQYGFGGKMTIAPPLMKSLCTKVEAAKMVMVGSYGGMAGLVV